ncbi:hypothetical protein HGRIS_010015 [Hohenbuehelia grisea]|uniref:Fms interacting protein n=1 Tax=Hohenbuehelia grisea TaxID=104357 RepID=A0ABR3J4G2_9AGAR
MGVDTFEQSSGLPPSPDAIVDKLREVVSASPDAHDPVVLQIRANTLIGRLKALNREANSATRLRKEETAAARHEMDQSHLGLQNLLYEKRHLEREIEKCRQFASVYQDVPLYTLDDFIQIAPPEARSDDVLTDEHQLMLNRLSFELAERQRLDLKRRELLKKKEEMLKQSKSKQDTLDNVKSQIDQLIKSASDIQKKVDELVQIPDGNTTSSV